LVDADFLDTEAHFTGKRRDGEPFEYNILLNLLKQYLQKIRLSSKASREVREVRDELWDTCIKAANKKRGFYNLSAPTGSGKTLALLGFALQHAKYNNLRRVIMVIPYLSIIEQTAAVYRKAFCEELPEELVLEHHSLVVFNNFKNYHSKLLTQNWDGPFIVTTNVQFLESLFANRPGACRKLHRIAKSVILLDEVQLLPLHLIVPTLIALRHLVDRYGCSVVFSTATQPAFDTFRKYTKIKAKSIANFKSYKNKKVKVLWPKQDYRITWDELAGKISKENQVLCVVNTKRHVLQLVEALRKIGCDDLLVETTNLCPAHRRVVLDKLRQSTKIKRLIATQCIEAGVDIDLPCGFRAMGPFDSIVQIAGRIGREGLSAGWMEVFEPETGGGPPGIYQQATDVTRALLHELGELDIYNSELYKVYFRRLYNLVKPHQRMNKLKQAIDTWDFVGVARHYKVIDNNYVNLLVPYDKNIFNKLLSIAENNKINHAWIQKAQHYSVQVPYHHLSKNFQELSLPKWFALHDSSLYDPVLGLVL
jgi:CRISPR/Cas system-associated endonuclease/helicase Cas3